jgi:hypothetical protein
MDVSTVSFQFGFVGQQPGIGYLLLRYGDIEDIPEAFEKGLNIIDFWVNTAMTESGLPYMCYHPAIKGFEPYPHYIRMLADGLEAILDAYMAACAYTYFRLYVITGDEHYLDFAKFIYKNTRQSTDVDGNIGYIMPGLGHESGNFTNQVLEIHYHWLPWCTFVQVEPITRLYDTFGVFEIEDALKLSSEELARKNHIYDSIV